MAKLYSMRQEASDFQRGSRSVVVVVVSESVIRAETTEPRFRSPDLLLAFIDSFKVLAF